MLLIVANVLFFYIFVYLYYPMKFERKFLRGPPPVLKNQAPPAEKKSWTPSPGLLELAHVCSRADSHLSKGSSGRKQKCTQFPTPFSGTVFDALSHGVIHFVRSVSFKNLEMEVF